MSLLDTPSSTNDDGVSEQKRRRFSLTGRTVYVTATTSTLIYLIIGPLLILLYSSFRTGRNRLPFEREAEWTFQNYIDVFASASTYNVMWNTFIYAVGALSISFSISIILAWLVERTTIPFRTTIYIVVIASLGIPAVLNAISWGLLLNPRTGAINIFLRTIFPWIERGPFDVYTMYGLIFVQGVTMVPITFLLITAAFRAMDSVLEEAATISGAPFATSVRRITLPVLTPALLSALVYQLVTVVESFDVPLVIGLRGNITVLSTRIFLEVRPPLGLPDYGLASTYSVLMLMIAAVPLFYYQFIISKSERFGTVSGKDYRQKRYDLGRARIPVLILVFGYLMASVGFPLLMLLWTSLQPFYAPPSMEALSRVNLNAYSVMFSNPTFSLAVRNTFLVGIITAMATMVMGFSVAWVSVRVKTRASKALDILAFLPHAFPGVILALSILLIYLILPFNVVSTIWIIIIALGTQYIALSSRVMTSSIVQIKGELEEAAAVGGAKQWATMYRIVLPLVRPAFMNGLLLIFLMAIKNLTQALLLYSPRSVVLSTLIYNRWDNGRVAETAALGVFTVAITLVLSVVARRATRAT